MSASLGGDPGQFLLAVESATLGDLVALGEGGWSELAGGIHQDPGRFERLVRRIHFARMGTLSAQARRAACRFFEMAYETTADVRYYNELLWISEGFGKERAERCRRLFADRVDSRGFHPHPKVTPEQARSQAEAIAPPDTIAPPDPGLTKIALLGPPYSFRFMAIELKKYGFEPRCVFLSGIRKARLSAWKRFGPVVRLFNVFHGYSGRFSVLGSDPAKPEITDGLRRLQCPIAVQRLGTIIRQPLLSAFSGGVLNDHWGLLPYFRGRNTVEFSVLHGLPAGATAHQVDTDVDTGPIVCGWTYDKQPGEPFDAFLGRLRGGSDARLVLAVRLAAREGFVPKDNPFRSGLQYYRMHPELLEITKQKAWAGLGP